MFRICRTRATRDAAGQGDTTSAPNPDHAWKTLALVNEWIRHSDAKATVTLAFNGVLGTMVFNLVKDFEPRTTTFDLLVVTACTFLALTAALCGWTLTPRVSDRDASPESINLLYFGSISHHFKGKRTEYGDELSTLIADPSDLVRDLAAQIHANSQIATIKARSAKWAIRSALTTGANVAVLATTVGISNT